MYTNVILCVICLDEPPPQFGVVLPPTTLPALVQDMNSPATRISYKPLTVTIFTTIHVFTLCVRCKAATLLKLFGYVFPSISFVFVKYIFVNEIVL